MKKRMKMGGKSSRIGLELLLAVWVAVFLAGCKSGTAPNSEDPFPASGEVVDWAKSSATRTFAADHLWEYIDGDAERYLQAGVVKVLTSDYKFKGQVDAVVDIYSMKSTEGARKVFDAEPSEGSKAASIGDAARLFPASLVFRKGRYLVRVVAYHEPPEIEKALLDLGQAIEVRLQSERP